MTAEKLPTDIPVLALTVAEAARSIGLSESVFRRDVLPHVRSVQVGHQRIVAVINELGHWLYLNGRFADED